MGNAQTIILGFNFSSGDFHSAAGESDPDFVLPVAIDHRELRISLKLIIHTAIFKAHQPGLLRIAEELGRRLAREGHTVVFGGCNIGLMESVAKAVGFEVKPTPTWCRHSFASNLIQAGVPKEYISASMAHSEGGTTDNYIDRYSFEQMTDYNSRLLADPAEKDRERLKKMLAGMSKEEILKLIGE